MRPVGIRKNFAVRIKVSEYSSGISQYHQISNPLRHQMKPFHRFPFGDHFIYSFQASQGLLYCGTVCRVPQIEIRASSKSPIMLKIFIPLGGYGEGQYD